MENEKNILLLVPRLNIGGAETYVATVAMGLKERGYQVFIASGGGILADSLQEKGIQHFFLPIRFSTEISAYLLGRIIKKYNIKLVHANSAAAGITALIAKQKYSLVSVVYTAHGVFGHKKRERRLNECDRIICVSDFVRYDAIKKGIQTNKLITLYSGIDLNKFEPNDKSGSQTRRKLGIPDDVFVMAIVSRIKNLKDKGHLDILNLLKEYSGAKNWHLIVVGKGKGMWKLKYYLWRYHLRERVHCVGHIVDVENILDGVDAVVLPSKFETFGLVLAEAMAMGKPVVAYAVGGTPEVIVDGHTGFLVEKDNLRELYQKIEMLSKNRNVSNEMGEQGREWVKTHFRSDMMIENVIDVYKTLMR